jgi:hypothetical protein
MMKTMSLDGVASSIKDRVVSLDEDMAELSLLIPGWQAAQVERLAHSRGLTLGQLIRLLIRDYLADWTFPSNLQQLTD